MDIREVKQNLGKTVYYDTLQLNFDGCRRVAAQDKSR